MRILFVLSTEAGQIHQAFGPAMVLEEQGHEVAFWCRFDIRETVRDAGMSRLFWHEDTRPIDPLEARAGQWLSKQLKDKDWTKSFVQSQLLDHVGETVPNLREAVRNFRPHIMVVTPTVYEGAIVALTERLPWATFTASLAPFMPEVFKTELSEQIAVCHRDRERLFNRFDLSANFCQAEVLSPQLNLAFTTDELLGNRVNSNYKRVGPSIAPRSRGDDCDFPWHKISDTLPLVYFSMGKRTYYQMEMLSSFFRAVSERNLQALCMVGDLANQDVLASVPKNVILCRYAPQMSVLPAVSLFVTAGGATSVMESIYFGVPMLVSPIWGDQPHQAHFIDKSGLGTKVDLISDPPVELGRQIDLLLSPKKPREKLEKISLSYKRNDGAAEAARLICQLANPS